MAKRRGFLTRLIDRFASRQSVPENVDQIAVRAEEAPRQLIVAEPRGIVYEGALQPGAVAAWMATAQKEYTTAELRLAARLPVVSMILATIIRDLHSSDMRIGAPQEDGDSRSDDVNLLDRILAKPYRDGLDTFRTATGEIARDLMVLGHSDIELLRTKMGQASRVARQFNTLPAGEMPLSVLLRQLEEALDEKGPIRGWQVQDPEAIRVNINEHGTLEDPAYYDVSPVYSGLLSMPGNIAYNSNMVSWDQWDFCRLIWQSTTEKDKRAEGVGSVEDGYPLIDLLWTLLVRLSDEIEQPTRDKILAFQPSGAVPLTGDQVTALVNGMRLDMQNGLMPILGGVGIDVKDLGPNRNLDYLTILDQISVMLWVLFGSGLVQMGHVDTSSRATAQVQIEASRKQAVGNLKKIILEDFVRARLIADPWSEFRGLRSWWEDTDLFMGLDERMEIYGTLMQYGFPVGAVVLKEFPELAKLLERLGYDPMELLPPSALSASLATAAADLGSAQTAEEVRETMDKMQNLLRAEG